MRPDDHVPSRFNCPCSPATRVRNPGGPGGVGDGVVAAPNDKQRRRIALQRRQYVVVPCRLHAPKHRAETGPGVLLGQGRHHAGVLPPCGRKPSCGQPPPASGGWVGRGSDEHQPVDVPRCLFRCLNNYLATGGVPNESRWREAPGLEFTNQTPGKRLG